jgi:hypothetical protein
MTKTLYVDGANKPRNIDFVYNPEDWDYISQWIIRHHPDQRAALFTSAAMGWNLAIHLNNRSK